MKKLFTHVGMAMILFIALSFSQNAKAQLVINEFMASNDQALPGPLGDYPDWIEIYNAGDEDISLAGYYMSDDLYDPEKMFQIPATYPDSVTVPAGGFIVFYANKDEDISVMNLDFKLSGDGEEIGFWSPDEVFVDSLTFGPQETDISYGRYPDGTDNWFFMEEYTPGAANQHTTAIAEKRPTESFTIFPNPCKSTLNIDFKNQKPDEILIQDISGKAVLSKNKDANFAGQIQLNTASLPTGLYFINIRYGNQWENKKLNIIR